MTNEEFQKMMEFIIKQQEVFVENIEKADARMNRLETAFVGLFDLVSETTKVQKEIVETQKELVASQRGLFEMQKHTEERLHTLIALVERLVTDGRNDTFIN